jgi:hypothetical protein
MVRRIGYDPARLTLASGATIKPKLLVNSSWKVMCSMRKSDYEALIESLYFGMVLPRGNGMDAAENAGGGDRTHTILRSLDFESSASASSATPARRDQATKEKQKLKHQ